MKIFTKNKFIIIVLIIFTGLFSSYLISKNLNFNFKRSNFHQINNKNKSPIIFRSARLGKVIFEEKIIKHKIDTVISFLGYSKDDWYREELESCKKLGIKHYDFGFSVKTLLSKKRFLEFFDLLDKIKANNNRVLIHCKSGSDRTGLMSAIIQMYLYDFNYQEALSDSFFWYYGHIKNKNCSVEKVLADYKAFSKKMSIKEWIEQKYNSELYRSCKKN